MLSNIHLNNKNAKDVRSLYLFYRLRFYAASNGGSIKNFSFTKNEKYNLLPKLIKNGWVHNNRVVSYRKVCKKNGCLGLWVNIDLDNLKDLYTFKGWLIATFEASSIRSANRRQLGKAKIYSQRDKCFIKNDWYSCGKNDEFNLTKKIGKDILSGRVYNGSISNLTGISTRSVSRWRKNSTNKYDLKKIISNDPYYLDRDESKFFRNKDLSFITLDLVIYTSIKVYNNKYYKYNTPEDKSLENFISSRNYYKTILE